VTIVVVLAFVCIGLVVTFAIALNEYFLMTREHLYKTVVLAAPDETLQRVRAREHELLTQPAVVDAAQGVYRIPIERAMSLQLQDGAKR
jgi:hypothetical protein